MKKNKPLKTQGIKLKNYKVRLLEKKTGRIYFISYDPSDPIQSFEANRYKFMGRFIDLKEGDYAIASEEE